MTDGQLQKLKSVIRKKQTSKTVRSRWRIMRRLEIHYTPKHGSWLDIAEIELNVMTRQCLSRRIETIDQLREELTEWEAERNRDQAVIRWHFQTGDARVKLISLYPTVVTANP